MVMRVAPSRGGFLRPFGCGWFIREFLLGNSPEGSRKIDPAFGAAQSDINYEYKEALARATAREKAERIISRMVLDGDEVTEEQAQLIYERQLKKISRKFTHMRYHSFLVYFGVLKRLGWVETTGESEAASIQENHSEALDRIYYRLTEVGKEANEMLWSKSSLPSYPGMVPVI